jgi:hypothetical protein
VTGTYLCDVDLFEALEHLGNAVLDLLRAEAGAGGIGARGAQLQARAGHSGALDGRGGSGAQRGAEQRRETEHGWCEDGRDGEDGEDAGGIRVEVRCGEIGEG